MAVGTVLSRVTGLGRVAAMAFAIGVAESRLADTYNIANTLPNVIYELLLGGVLTSVFIPVLVAQLKSSDDREEAWRGVSALVTVTMAVLVVAAIVAVLAAPMLMGIFTFRLPGAERAAQQPVAVFFFRFFALQIALYGYAAIAGGLLNSYNRFAIPMYAPILNNVVVIAMFLAFAAWFDGSVAGEAAPTDGQKYLLAAGTTLGVAAMALVHWPFVRRLPGRLRFKPEFGHPAVRKLARLSGWTLAYVVVNQAGFFVALILANGIQGGPTAYFVAFAFFQLPIGVVAVSIMTALVPTLAALAVEGGWERFRVRVDRGVRATSVVLLPATAAFVVLAEPAVRLLLEHGVMSAASGEMVAGVLRMFSIGILPFSLWVFFLRAFYAMQDAKTPFILNLVEVGATVVLDFALFPSLRIEGLALAHSLGYVVGAVLAGAVLARRVGGLGGRPAVGALARMGAAAIGALVAIAAGSWSGARLATGDLGALLQLSLGAIAGGAVFYGLARWLGVAELSVFRRMLSGGGSGHDDDAGPGAGSGHGGASGLDVLPRAGMPIPATDADLLSPEAGLE